MRILLWYNPYMSRSHRVSHRPNYNTKPGYKAVHNWVVRQLGSPLKCDKCGFTSSNSHQFHWANLSEEYKRDLNDWQRQCVSCNCTVITTHFSCGHTTDRANTYFYPNSYSKKGTLKRQCLTCKRKNVLEWRHQNKISIGYNKKSLKTRMA